MKSFNLNRIKIAHLEDIKFIVAGAGETDVNKVCKTEICYSVDHLICTNPTIAGDQTTKPVDREPK